jgi:hypothetical protein
MASRDSVRAQMRVGTSERADHGMLWTVLIMVPVTFVAILVLIVAVV